MSVSMPLCRWATARRGWSRQWVRACAISGSAIGSPAPAGATPVTPSWSGYPSSSVPGSPRPVRARSRWRTRPSPRSARSPCRASARASCGWGRRWPSPGSGSSAFSASSSPRPPAAASSAADLDPERIALALRLGADVAVRAGEEYETAVGQATAGRGADAVLITAATDSAEPVRQAGRLARDRAVVVVVGAVPADVPRSPFYEKEVDVRFSRSYGPGRYDPSYEEQGHDYPIGYVRWTEQRNLEAILDLLAQARLALAPLVTSPVFHRRGGASVSGADRPGRQGARHRAGVPGRRGADPPASISPTVYPLHRRPAAKVRVGVVGASGFARAVMIPALKELPEVTLRGMAAANGLNARSAATQAGFEYCTSEYRELLADSGDRRGDDRHPARAARGAGGRGVGGGEAGLRRKAALPH